MTLPIDPATGLQLPVAGGVVTQGYGPEQTDPEVRHLYRKGYHTGIDFGGVAEGTPVLSPSDGTVVIAGTNGGYGECVVVERSDGIEVLFGHLCRIEVRAGARVAVGQEIGGIGTTGVSTGVHLHLEYRRAGVDIDPSPFLQSSPADVLPAGPALRTSDHANFREQPGKDATVLDVVPPGAALTLRRDAYIPVRWNGRDGWIWGEYLLLEAGDAEASTLAQTPECPAELSPAPPAERMGHTTDDLHLRMGPGFDYAVLTTLPAGTTVYLLGEQGDWLQARAADREGYVHRDYIVEGEQPPAAGFLRSRAALARAALAPEPAAQIDALAMTDTERVVAATWNRYGGLLSLLSHELSIDPAIAVAVLAIEAGGRAFDASGRLIIRFESHIFYDEWGRESPELFARHFSFRAGQSWQDHLWRPSPAADWREFHGDQAAEWQVFALARTLNDTAAKRSISMGAPQIMGFNHEAIGYASVHEMFDAFSASEQAQLIGFFDFVRGASANSPRLLALQRQDFYAFATLYNGAGQATTYAALMTTAWEAFHRLRPT